MGTQIMTNADWLRAFAGWLESGQPEMVSSAELERIADEIDIEDRPDGAEACSSCGGQGFTL